MRLTKHEKTVLSELLEAGAETPEVLAENFVAKLDELRAERYYHAGLVIDSPRSATAIGPFTTPGPARKAAVKYRDAVGGEYAVVTYFTPEGVEAHYAKVDEKPPTKGDYKTVAEDARAFKNGWDGKQKTRSSFL